MTVPSIASRLRLRVSAAAEGHIRAGHPWVYEASIRDQNRAGLSGEYAVIYDRRDRFLAIGLYDPDSVLRVRVLHQGKPAMLDETWWKSRLEETFSRRFALFGMPTEEGETTGYRLINGESDGFGGLVLDRYDNILVMKIYTSAWFMHLTMLFFLIKELLPNNWSIILRLSRNITEKATSIGLRDGIILDEYINGNIFQIKNPVVFKENGLYFEADVLKGQKTGFFLDQRENRKRVQKLAHGRRVLNAFSFNGGFSVYAARGGAHSVTSLDISRHALEGAERNFELNSLVTPHEIVQADVFEWLGNDRVFDLVILDPPSLARREHERAGAVAAYGKLARAGASHLPSGGVLVSASCSAHVSSEEFYEVVRREVGRPFRELMTTQHAPDHHANFAEAQYLKAIFLELD